MRIIVDADTQELAQAAGRADLLQFWQTCPDCGGPSKAAYWRPRWEDNGAASHGLVCPDCPDRPETPIRDWAPETNGES